MVFIHVYDVYHTIIQVSCQTDVQYIDLLYFYNLEFCVVNHILFFNSLLCSGPTYVSILNFMHQYWEEMVKQSTVQLLYPILLDCCCLKVMLVYADCHLIETFWVYLL